MRVTCQGIEEMLNELRDRFSDERSKLEKEDSKLGVARVDPDA